MPIIYKITNTNNNKNYIGKTSRTMHERWIEHCKASITIDRPLYRAMRKYGIDNFIIEEIERVDTDEQACEREQYWINYYNSYGDGYNATLGGDGKAYIDRDEVVNLYQQTKNCCEVARQLNIYEETVRNILHDKGIKILTSQEVNHSRGQQVDQYTKDGVFIKTFESFRQAAFEVAGRGGGAISHIKDVCSGIRKSAYGYKWKNHEED